MSDGALVPQQADFSIGKIDLAALQKDLKGHQKDAIALLARQLAHEDAKIAQNAAKLILEMNIEVADKIANDHLTRVIAQARLVGGSQMLGAQKALPIVDFDNIQPVG